MPPPARRQRDERWEQESPKRPKIDAFDRFDDTQSPLQRNMLDARDEAWRKRARLGSNPECSRIVREFARERQPKLCFDGEDLAPCFDKSSAPDECVSEIFGKKTGQPRIVDCLENPFDDQGEIRNKYPFDSLNIDGDCINGLEVTSDCLTDSGDLRAGFDWNVDQEDCDGVNDDNDCMFGIDVPSDWAGMVDTP